MNREMRVHATIIAVALVGVLICSVVSAAKPL
ncbi:MAG: hypothetical protein ACI9HK_001214, partial [Pirellulaceae bacterium]